MIRKKGKIFISYRRDDSGGHAGRIYSDLVRQFGKLHVFRDIDDMVAGDDFVKAIESAISSANVLLVIIGKDWLNVSNENGKRLNNSKDFVRLEIVNAFRKNVPVIPVLVQGAQMPKPEQLPAELQPLVTLQAIEISDTRWLFDIDQLIKLLENILNWRSFKPRQVTWIVAGLMAVMTVAFFAYKYYTSSQDLLFKGRVDYTVNGLKHSAGFKMKFKISGQIVTGEYTNSEGDQGVFTGTLVGNSLDIKFVSSQVTGDCNMQGRLHDGRSKLVAIYKCTDGETADVAGERYFEE